PARGRRARDPRPQRPGTRALPVGEVLRERRLDGHGLPGPQPAALDVGTRPARPDRPRRPHAAPPAARLAWPADAHRQTLDAASAGPLALAAGLRRGAGTHPSAHARRLTGPPAHRPR